MSDQSRDKRICFVTTLPMTLKAFVHPQAEYLLQNGWDVTWICAEDPNFYNEVPAGVRYIPLPFKRGIEIFGIPRAIFLLYRLFKRECFDIVQYSTPNAAFYASIAAWLAGVKVRLYAQWGIRYVGFHGVPRKLFKILEQWCCWCSTIIEPDSLNNLDFSIKEGLYPQNKGRVIWNGSSCGVNLNRFDITQKDKWRTEYRKKIGLESQHLVIGFVGSIRRDKGCNELISACRSLFRDMPYTRLLLVGDKQFYRTIDRDLRDWVASSPQVIHIRRNNEIPQYMACTDIFSLPSYREGFPMVVVEAQAMGIPVVVSNVPGPIDAMRDKETGLVVPVKDAEMLASALQTLLKDKTKRMSFGRAAATFVRENFDQKEYLRHVFKDKEELLLGKQSATEGYAWTVKRIFDLTVVIAGFLCTWPLFLVLMLLVRYKLGSPVLFRQARPGLHGKPFEIIKFRTMTDARDSNGSLLPDSERLTRFGSFLRKTSLDELPELWNVLKGDMSLVGPRPLLMQYLDRYTPEQARRHAVKPGMTGWAQVNGRNALSWEEKFKLDVWYVDHQSFWLDMKIIAMTIWKVLRREGISQTGQATVEYFEGSKVQRNG